MTIKGKFQIIFPFFVHFPSELSHILSIYSRKLTMSFFSSPSITMIDNEDPVLDLFTNGLVMKSLPEMDRNLMTQMMESMLILSTVDNKDGTGTALRAVCQEEAFNIRLDNCIQLSNRLWTAVIRPGAYTARANKWLENLQKEVLNAFFEVYGPQLEEIGVTRQDLKLKGTSLNSKLEP